MKYPSSRLYSLLELVRIREPATKCVITVVLALMVASSPVLMFVIPSEVIMAMAMEVSPSTIGQDGSDFTTQAALSSLTARPTNNIVDTNSF